MEKELEMQPTEEELQELEQETETISDVVATTDTDYIGDSAQVYLKEIGQIALLSHDQEIELAKCIEAGNIAEENIKKLVPEDQNAEKILADLVKKRKKAVGSKKGALTKKINAITTCQNDIAAGKQARDELMEANLRLVVSIAKHHVGRGLAMADMIQEGNLGLLKAVDKFDYRLGYKFSTYATWWIKQGITRAIADQSKTIRLPVHVTEKINKYTRLTKEYLQEHGYEPSVAEISQMMNLPQDKVLELIRIAEDPVSLDVGVGEDKESTLQDFIQIDDGKALTEMDLKALSHAIDNVLDELNEKERNIIILRFGMHGGRPHTLEEVGQIYHVTRERIRQIEAKAMKRLRFIARRQHLKDFLIK